VLPELISNDGRSLYEGNYRYAVHNENRAWLPIYCGFESRVRPHQALTWSALLGVRDYWD